VDIPLRMDGSGRGSGRAGEPCENQVKIGGWSGGRSSVQFGFADWCGLGGVGLTRVPEDLV
jgi:hypothetical protein